MKIPERVDLRADLGKLSYPAFVFVTLEGVIKELEVQNKPALANSLRANKDEMFARLTRVERVEVALFNKEHSGSLRLLS